MQRRPDSAQQVDVRRLLLLLALCLLAAASTVLASVPAGRDTVQDGWSWSADVSWFPMLVIIACSAGHYVAAAACTRAASRTRLPMVETTAAQLCASSANKVTPAGLGGSAVLARYLVRRAGVPTSEAVGTVAVVGLARAVASVVTLAVLALAAPVFGWSDGLSAVVRLLARLQRSAALPWVAVGLAVAMVAAVVVARRSTRLRGLGSSLRAVASSPRRASTLLGASAVQSLLLGIAFACATVTLPGQRPSASLLALVVGYLLAAAVAAAVPTPGGIGSSEVALTAVLVAASMPLGQAVADVLLFRVLTLWVPAVAGLPCARALRRRGAL